MKPLNVITLAENRNDEDRIGPNKRSAQSESALELELLLQGPTPLPVSFDVTPVQPHYFSEFVYYDTMGGLLLQTMSSEISALLMEDALLDTSPDYEALAELGKRIHDKYELSKEIDVPEGVEIAFLPGSNLLHTVNREILDRAMLKNPALVIKPHPITRPETLRFLGVNYGYGRVVEPSVSGVALLKRASKIYTASSSELGIMAAALKIPCFDMSSVRHQPFLTYSGVYRLFEDGNVEHNAKVVATLLANKASGFLMPWFKDNELRMKKYMELAMLTRECYRPMYAANIYNHGIPKNIGEKNAVCKG